MGPSAQRSDLPQAGAGRDNGTTGRARSRRGAWAGSATRCGRCHRGGRKHGPPGEKALDRQQREAVLMKETRKTNKGEKKEKIVRIILSFYTMRSCFAK